jgi:hypothetical protein
MHQSGGVGLVLALLAGAAACGDGNTEAAPVAAPEMDAPFALTVDSRASSFESLARVAVLEGEPLVTLTLVGGDDTDNFLSITAQLEGPENIRRLHSMPFGTVDDSVAYASASLEGQTYSSQAGTLEVSFVPEGGLRGTFEISLLPYAEPAGAAAETDAMNPPAVNPPAGSLMLSGEFSGGFNVTCASPVRGFTGSHSVDNSPYCQSLEL